MGKQRRKFSASFKAKVALAAVKQWLAACLWYNLVRNEMGGLVSHSDLVQRCEAKGVVTREWMDSRLQQARGNG